MREFLYKNSFLRYFFSLFNRSRFARRRESVLIFFACYFALISAIVGGILGITTALVLFALGAYLGNCRRGRPNLTGLMPLTSRRKVVYQFLSPLFLLFLIFVGLLLLIIIYIILTYLNGLLFNFNPGNLFADLFNGYIDLQNELYGMAGPYGTSFSVFFTVICYSAGMIYGSVYKRSHRLIFGLAFYAVMYLGLNFMSLPFVLSLPPEERYFTFIWGSPFFGTCYEAMAFPWLSIVLCGCCAVASVVAAATVVGKNFGAKDF